MKVTRLRAGHPARNELPSPDHLAERGHRHPPPRPQPHQPVRQRRTVMRTTRNRGELDKAGAVDVAQLPRPARPRHTAHRRSTARLWTAAPPAYTAAIRAKNTRALTNRVPKPYLSVPNNRPATTTPVTAALTERARPGGLGPLNEVTCDPRLVRDTQTT